MNAAQTIQNEKDNLKHIINVLEEDQKAMLIDKKLSEFAKVPETEEEILKFLDQPHLENQPTEVLYTLAEKLRERRAKLYPEEEVIEKVESGVDLGRGYGEREESQQQNAESSKQIEFEDEGVSNLNKNESE